MATKLRVEVEDATAKGAASVAANLAKLNDPEALSRLIAAVEAAEAKFSELAQRIGQLEGPDVSKLLADLDAVEKRFRGLRKAAENPLELPIDELTTALEGHLQNLVTTARQRFGEIRTEAAKTADAMADLERPITLQIDTSPLSEAESRTRNLAQGSERSTEGRILLDDSAVASAIKSLQTLREDLPRLPAAEIELSSNIPALRSQLDALVDRLNAIRAVELEITPTGISQTRKDIDSLVQSMNEIESAPVALKLSGIEAAREQLESLRNAMTFEPVELKVDATQVQAAIEAVEALARHLAQLPAVEIPANAGQVVRAQELVVELSETVEKVPDIEVDVSGLASASENLKNLSDQIVSMPSVDFDSTDLSETNRQVEQLVQNSKNLDFEPGIEDLRRLRDEARSANKVVEDLFQQRSQLEGGLRQVRAAAESIRVVGDTSEAATKQLDRLADEEERLVSLVVQNRQQLDKAVDAAGDYARGALKAADAADDMGKETQDATRAIERINRVAEKNQLKRFATDARLARTELRRASGGASDFIGAIDRLGRSSGATSRQTSALAKGLLDGSQAFFLNTRASNEAFNAVQRLEGGFGPLSIAVVGGVASFLAYKAAVDANNSALKKLADNGSTEAKEKLKEITETTEEVSAAFGEMVSSLAEGDGVLSNLFQGAGDSAQAFKKAIRDIQLDIADGSGLGFDAFGSRLALLFADAVGASGDFRDTLLEDAIALDDLAEKRGENAAISQKALETLKEIRDTEREISDAAEAQNLFNGKSIEQLREISEEKQRAVEAASNSPEDFSPEDALKTFKEAKAAAEALGKAEQENLKKKLDLTEKLAELERKLADERATANLPGEDGLERRKNELADVRSITKDIVAESRILSEIEAARQKRIESLTGSIEAEFRAIEIGSERGTISAAELEHRMDAINAKVKRRTTLENDAAKQIEEARKAQRSRLAALEQQQRAATEARDFDKQTVQQRIDSETQVDELLRERERLLKRVSADSAEAQEQANELAEEFRDAIEANGEETDDLISKLKQLEGASKGGTSEAEALRKKLADSVELTTALKQKLDQFDQTTEQSVVKSLQAAFDARVKRIEDFLAQQEKQTGQSALGQVSGQISEKDVSREVFKRRQEQFEEQVPAALQKVVDELGRRGIGSSVKDGKVVADNQSDAAAARRAQSKALEDLRRKNFKLPQNAADKQQERNDVRADLTRKMIDGLEGNRKISAEAAEALRTQLSELSKNSESQHALTKATDQLAKAITGQASKSQAKQIKQEINGTGESADLPVGQQPGQQQPTTQQPGPQGSATGDPDQLAAGFQGFANATGQQADAASGLNQAMAQGFNSLGGAVSAIAADQVAVSNLVAQLTLQVSQGVQANLAQGRDTRSRGMAAVGGGR